MRNSMQVSSKRAFYAVDRWSRRDGSIYCILPLGFNLGVSFQMGTGWWMELLRRNYKNPDMGSFRMTASILPHDDQIVGALWVSDPSDGSVHGRMPWVVVAGWAAGAEAATSSRRGLINQVGL